MIVTQKTVKYQNVNNKVDLKIFITVIRHTHSIGHVPFPPPLCDKVSGITSIHLLYYSQEHSDTVEDIKKLTFRIRSTIVL